MNKTLEQSKTKGYKEKLDDFLQLGKAPFDYEKKLLLEHRARVKAIIQGKNLPPYELEIQPSSYCTAGCIHCFGKVLSPLDNRLYNKSAVDRVISEVLNFKRDGFQIDNVKFCGSTGEPLMNPLTTYMIGEFSKERHTILFTNGMLIGKRKNDKEYLEEISKVNNLVLSLDAGTTKTLWEVKPGVKKAGIRIEDILQGVSKIKENAKTVVDVSYVIDKKNYFDLVNGGKAAKASGADSIKIRIDMVDREVSEKYANDIKRLIKEVKTLEDDRFKVVAIHSDDEVAETDVSGFQTKKCPGSCFTSKLWACIGADGSIYPCGHIVNKQTENYGNILEKSFEEIWDDKRKAEIISNLPAKYCVICSPSSLRRNNLMKFLKEIKEQEGYGLVSRLIDNSIGYTPFQELNIEKVAREVRI
jgi:radical SAM protein with 4Fe4S-binding SPASM domain